MVITKNVLHTHCRVSTPALLRDHQICQIKIQNRANSRPTIKLEAISRNVYIVGAKQSQLSNVRNERRRCKTIRRGEENLYSLFLKIISQSLIRSEIFLLSSLPACFMMFLRESRFEVVKNKPSPTVTSLCSRFASLRLSGAISWSVDNGRSRSLIGAENICELDSAIKAIAKLQSTNARRR